MLKFAYSYQKQLEEIVPQLGLDDKYKYYFARGIIDFTEEIKPNSMDVLQFVSVDTNNNVLGYMAAYVDQRINTITSLSLLNFGLENITFSHDAVKFFDNLFTKYNFRKAIWGVVVGNPAEKIYDKIITKYSGRIVGKFKDDVKLWDGFYYDWKMYEVFNPRLTEEAR